MTPLDPTRRAFVAGSGALAVAILLPGSPRAEASRPRALGVGERIEVRSDGTVRVFVGRIEMGQGLVAAVSRIAADELDVALERVVVPPVDTASSPNEGFTDSSASVASTGMAVRQAAAEARAVLLAAAARRLGVDPADIAVRDGTVEAGAASVTYWDLLAAGVASSASLDRVRPKPAAARRLAGQEGPRLDLLPKLTGAPAFIQDLRLDGMAHARVVRPPSPGASLRSVEASAVRAMPGVVEVVQGGSFLAVVARREDEAERAAAQLRSLARWREEETLPGREALFDHLWQEADLPVQDPVAADGHLVADYAFPYRMHGSIAPSCALAEFSGSTLTVWSHAQGPYPLRGSIAELVGLPASSVRCVHVEGAGCYGHNGADDAAADAALIAMALPDRPVRLQWSRGDEHAWEPYGPATLVRISGAVDARGRISEWDMTIASPTHSSRPGGAARLLAARHVDPPIAPSFLAGLTQWAGGSGYNAEPGYDVPARIDRRFVRQPPLRSSALRGLGAFANVTAIESAMDELAALAGSDPVDFRLAHLSDPRARAVVEAAAERFGWQAAGPGSGRGLGYARYANRAAYVAVAVEAARKADGGLSLLRAVAAVDCGEAVDPDGVRSQIEGGIVQAASWALLEDVAFDRTRVTATDWDSYPILRITDAPEVEVILLHRPEAPCLGVGEAAAGPAGGAVANAMADLLGERRRTLPLVS